MWLNVCECGGGVGGGVYNNAIILRMITCGQSSYVEIGCLWSSIATQLFQKLLDFVKKKLLKETKTTKTIHLANISPFKYSSLLLNKNVISQDHCFFFFNFYFFIFITSLKRLLWRVKPVGLYHCFEQKKKHQKKKLKR